MPRKKRKKKPAARKTFWGKVLTFLKSINPFKLFSSRKKGPSVKKRKNIKTPPSADKYRENNIQGQGRKKYMRKSHMYGKSMARQYDVSKNKHPEASNQTVRKDFEKTSKKHLDIRKAAKRKQTRRRRTKPKIHF